MKILPLKMMISAHKIHDCGIKSATLALFWTASGLHLVYFGLHVVYFGLNLGLF